MVFSSIFNSPLRALMANSMDGSTTSSIPVNNLFLISSWISLVSISCSTTFSINEKELAAKGYNKRSSEHIDLYNKKPFDQTIHKKFLNHEEIENLKGLEVEMIYKWCPGEILIFDRTSLHCSSSNLSGKKIGFTTSTLKNEVN